MNVMNKEISWYVTTGDEKLLLKNNSNGKIARNIKSDNKIFIDINNPKQVIDGFGAAVTESSAYLLQKLDEESRLNILKDLFTDNGSNFSMIRKTIGASDFSLSNYTYDDLGANELDNDLKKFTLKRDFDFVLPIIKQIFNLKDVKIISSPWSAPAWMKDNNSLNGGRLRDDMIDVYANYLTKYIIQMSENGFPIYGITPQNEPLHEVLTYPTMFMESNQQAKLINKMGINFKKANIKTKIIAYDHNWNDIDYSVSLYKNALASKYISGTGFHCYSGDVSNTQKLANEYPDKDIWFTECSGGAWAEVFADNLEWNIENVFMKSIKYGAKSVLLWNLALDENYGPTNGGCLNCRGVITIKNDNTYLKNVEYYLLAHYSKFIPSNSFYLESVFKDETLLVNSFLTPSKDIVIVIYNKNNYEKEVSFEIFEKSYKVTLLKKSLNTFTIKR